MNYYPAIPGNYIYANNCFFSTFSVKKFQCDFTGRIYVYPIIFSFNPK